MRRREFLLASSVALLPSTFLRADAPESSAWHADVHEAWQLAQAQQRPLLLYITMPGCGYCRKMEADTLRDPAIAEHIQQNFVAAHFDGQANPQLARRLGVQVYPTTVIVAPENRIIASIRGYVAPQQMQARLAAAVSADVAQQTQSSSRRRR